MPEINYPYLASTLFNTPLMCTPELRESVLQAIMPRLMGKSDTNILINTAPQNDPLALNPSDKERDAARIEYRTHKGVAIISVHGILTTRRGNMDANCGEITSYEKLSGLLDAALVSTTVEHIVYDVQSNGGVGVGCFDFAERIYQARGLKPSTAIINYNAYSAAYALASAADEVIVSTTSGVGSIGVIATHVNTRKALDDAGLKLTTFYRGHHKNDLSPHEPVSKDAAKELNRELDEMYELFIQTVARNRNIKPKVVKATEAKTYRGQRAIDMGLADKLMYPQDAINAIAQAIVERKAKAVGSSPKIAAQAAALMMQSQH